MNDAAVTRIAEERLHELIVRALTRAGAAEAPAQSHARSMAACERDGARNHGLLRLPGVVRALHSGWITGDARPTVVSETSGALVVDAGNGFAQPALDAVRDRLLEKARSAGVAVLHTRDSHHVSALWPDIEPLAEAGLVALTCVHSRARMAVWGGREPVVGTSAIAFAAPRAGESPFVWDQSSSVMSQGEILLARAEGREVPPGVGCDRDGRPTTDPAAILDGGFLLPFGGHKGSAIAVMVEVLAAALSGADFGFESGGGGPGSETSRGGQFLLLMPADADVASRVSGLSAAIIASGATRFPGERRFAARADAARSGIPVDGDALVMLLELAGETRA